MRRRLALGVLLLLAVPGGARATAASISGTVTDAAGTPIDTICVEARTTLPYLYPLPHERYTAVTAADGTYQLAGMAPGPYRVQFRECAGGGPLGGGEPPRARHDTEAFAPQWWQDSDVEEGATPVFVALTPIDGIDATLAPHPGITGTVTADDGSPAVGISVSAVTPDGSEWRSTTTDAHGHYKVVMDPRTSSTWAITFASPVAEPRWGEFAQEWYDDASSLGDATLVDHVAGTILPGIDAVLERTGTIAGSVTNARGEALEVCLSVYDASGEQVVWTTGFGPFSVGGLETGSYKLVARDCSLFGYEDAWYGGGSSFDEARWIGVTWGRVTTGADLVLRDGGSLSGRVTDAGGAPRAGWYVLAEDLQQRFAWTAVTAADGTYHMGPLVPSTVIVTFYRPDGQTIAEFYDDAGSRENATPVTVIAESETSGIDAVV